LPATRIRGTKSTYGGRVAGVRRRGHGPLSFALQTHFFRSLALRAGAARALHSLLRRIPPARRSACSSQFFTPRSTERAKCATLASRGGAWRSTASPCAGGAPTRGGEQV
jgi:hypothetical protein